MRLCVILFVFSQCKLLKNEKQDIAQSPQEQPSHELKAKKSRKNKKKDSTSSETVNETQSIKVTDVNQKTISISKVESKEDVSVRTDSGIAESSESSTAKKKSKSKKQREKKAAAAAAAKEQGSQETKKSQAKEKLFIDLTPSTSVKPETKPKDKKKTSKNSNEAKTKEDSDKVQFDK